MSVSDASSPVPPRAAAPGFWGHLGRIALLACALLAGTFLGALIKALVDRAASPLAAALDFADDVSEPILVAVGIAALFALLRAALGEGMTRRRRLVSLRRRLRPWGRFAPLAWIPALTFVVFAEGSTLLIGLALPIIVIGLVWIGAQLSAAALSAGPLTYATVAIVGLAIGLFA